MVFAVQFLINPKSTAVDWAQSSFARLGLFRQKGFAAAAVKKGANGKRGTEVLSNSLMASVLIVAAVIVLFLLIKSIMCRTGTWFGGAC